MKNRRIVAGVVGVVVLFAGVVGWNAGRGVGWWGRSDEVAALWGEPVVVAVVDRFGDRDLRFEEPATGVGVKPVPAYVGVGIPGVDSGDDVLDLLKSTSESDKWTPLGTCPESFIFCATKRTHVGGTLLLTYAERVSGEGEAQENEGFLRISIN